MLSIYTLIHCRTSDLSLSEITQKVGYFTEKLAQPFQPPTVIMWGGQQEGLGEGTQKAANGSGIIQIQGAITWCYYS